MQKCGGGGSFWSTDDIDPTRSSLISYEYTLPNKIERGELLQKDVAGQKKIMIGLNVSI